jgi:hypothetical protein
MTPDAAARLRAVLGDPHWLRVAAQECEGPSYIAPWLRKVAKAMEGTDDSIISTNDADVAAPLRESGWFGHLDDKGRVVRVHDINSVHMDGCTPLYVLDATAAEGEGGREFLSPARRKTLLNKGNIIMREPSVSVYGWVDPISGDRTRRTTTSIKLWKYTTGKFGEEDIIFFAVPGIKTKTEALEIGYALLAAKFALEGQE